MHNSASTYVTRNLIVYSTRLKTMTGGVEGYGLYSNIRGIIGGISCLLSCTPIPFCKGVYSSVANSFPLELTPFQKRQTQF